MTVHLLTFPGCPHAAAARDLLERVVRSHGIVVNIEEIDMSASDTPPQFQGWGSPTILIDGADVEGEPSRAGANCRLYRNSAGQSQGIPSESALIQALRR